MSKSFLSFSTVIACLAAFAICALPAVAGMGADGDTTASTLQVKYKEADERDPYGKPTFKGSVGPRKCAKARTVTIKSYGKEKTNSKGKFEFELTGPASPGKYKVNVKAKKNCAAVKTTLKVPRP